MAEVNPYRIDGTRKINWDLLFDGQRHHLSADDMAPMLAIEFGRHARKMAKRRRLVVKVQTTTTTKAGSRATVQAIGTVTG